MLTAESLYALLRRDDRIEALYGLTAEELACLLGPDFAAMKGYDQRNPHHDRDLLRHSLDTALYIRPESLPEELLPEIRAAALLHDVGKPASAKEKDGRLVFYGHDLKSALIAESVLREAGLPEEALRRVLFCVRYHEAFINYRLPEELALLDPKTRSGYSPIEKDALGKRCLKIKNAAGFDPPRELWLALITLCLADALAQANTVPGASKPDKIRRIERIRAITESII